MFGITDFRWFNDKTVRDARQASDEAHIDLNEYSEHYHETHPRDNTEAPEYYRLNAIAYDAHQNLKRARP